MRRALAEYVVLGIRTKVPFHLAVLDEHDHTDVGPADPKLLN